MVREMKGNSSFCGNSFACHRSVWELVSSKRCNECSPSLRPVTPPAVIDLSECFCKNKRNVFISSIMPLCQRFSNCGAPPLGGVTTLRGRREQIEKAKT
ncbi:hypothetical protein TNCV_2876531 [Trichonephila clavipes]|nr:hypothetical protein TNCV_2876531 [Trichonephila clavipes]